MSIRILVGAVLAFSLMLNVWHYRNFFRRVIHGKICSKPVSILDQSGAWYTKRPVLINHAGVWGGYRYMNSKQSISECMEHGCPVIEVDVNFTSDGIPVLTHWFAPDEDIMFFDKPSLQEFLSADYPGGHYPMTLDELMEKVKDYDGVFLIDVKMGEEREVAEWFASHYSFEQKQRLIFQVHDVRFLKELHEKNIFGYLHYNADIQTLETLLPYFKKYDVHTVSVSDWEVRDEKSIANLRNAGLHLYVYTVNHARRMKTLFEYGVDGVFTDCYGELVQELQ